MQCGYFNLEDSVPGYYSIERSQRAKAILDAVTFYPSSVSNTCPPTRSQTLR